MQGRGHQKAQVTEVKRVICGDRLNRVVWPWRSLLRTGKEGVGVHLCQTGKGGCKQGTALLRQVTRRGVFGGGGGQIGGHSLLSSGGGRKCGSGNLDRLSEDTDFSQRGLVVRCQAC